MRTRVVVLGGGFGGLTTTLSLPSELGDDVDLTLVSASERFLFTPLLCEVAGGAIAPDSISIPLRELAESSRFRFVHARAVAADHSARQVKLSNGDILEWDQLVVALGAVTATHGIPGAERALPYKTLDDAVALRGRVFEHFEQAAHESEPARRRALRTIAVVGGGVTGVELAAEIRSLLDREILPSYPGSARDDARVVILEARPRLLPELDEEVARAVERRLRNMGITVHVDAPVAEVLDESVRFRDGESAPAGTVVWAGGIRGSPDVAALGLQVDERGRARARATLEVEALPTVFALGDSARVPHPRTGVPHPATAQLASQQGEHCARSVARTIRGKRLEPFEAIDRGMIISLGAGFSVARIGGVTLGGRIGWLLNRSVHLAKLPGLKAKWGVTRAWLGAERNY